VAIVSLASFVLEDGKGTYWEISTELGDLERTRFREYVADRQIESLKPQGPVEARAALLGLIERITTRLTAKAEAHRSREHTLAALVPGILALGAIPN
jgi:hypothetical protein